MEEGIGVGGGRGVGLHPAVVHPHPGVVAGREHLQVSDLFIVNYMYNHTTNSNKTVCFIL